MNTIRFEPERTILRVKGEWRMPYPSIVTISELVRADDMTGEDHGGDLAPVWEVPSGKFSDPELNRRPGVRWHFQGGRVYHVSRSVADELARAGFGRWQGDQLQTVGQFEQRPHTLPLDAPQASPADQRVAELESEVAALKEKLAALEPRPRGRPRKPPQALSSLGPHVPST